MVSPIQVFHTPAAPSALVQYTPATTNSTQIGNVPMSAPTIIGMKLSTCSVAQARIHRDGLFTRAAKAGAKSCAVAPTSGGIAATSPLILSVDPRASANTAM